MILEQRLNVDVANKARYQGIWKRNQNMQIVLVRSNDYAEILRIISPSTEISCLPLSYGNPVYAFCAMNMNIVFYI